MRHPDPMIAHRKSVIGQIKTGLATMFALELRILRPTFKEIDKGLPQIGEGLFSRTLGHLIYPGKLLPFDGIELLFQVQRVRFLRTFARLVVLVLSFPLFQPLIVSKACRTCCFSEIRRLFGSGMQPNLVRTDHLESASFGYLPIVIRIKRWLTGMHLATQPPPARSHCCNVRTATPILLSTCS